MRTSHGHIFCRKAPRAPPPPTLPAYECTGSMNHMDVRQAVVDACTFQQTTFMANPPHPPKKVVPKYGGDKGLKIE